MASTSIVLATAWWAPLAIIGGALLGVVVAFAVLHVANAGSPEAPSPQAEQGYVRAEGRSELRWNPWAFVTAGVMIGLVVGLSIALSVD